MTNKNSKEIVTKRRLAILELLESSRNWDNEIYIDEDFLVDSMIRKYTDYPEKDIGKPPYDFIGL